MIKINTKKTVEKTKKMIGILEKLIRGFNFAFFLVSIAIWLVLTGIEIGSKPFEWSQLWSAFNVLYAQFSFKVSCIFLIVFNGLLTVRQWIFDYYELKEYGEHIWTLGKLIKPKKKE